MHEEDHIDGGLQHDLPRVLTRRAALTGLLGSASLAFLAACDSGSSPTASPQTGPTSSASSVGGTEVPEETAGPFPGDGSNGVNVLSEAGIVRSDIRASFGGSTAVAEGIPMTIVLKLLDVSEGKPLPGAAVYLWHCDREGNYSLYSQGVEQENYLRGVQATDSEGSLTFQSIFPACYQGRWPHLHFEVYPSLAKATSATNKLRTSQIALPKDACDAAYATEGYETSVARLSELSLDSDMVFSDGYSLQLAKVTGDASNGFTATLTVPV